MLRSLQSGGAGPGDNPPLVLRWGAGDSFYIDEFPEREHHPKESEHLFPAWRSVAPHVAEVIARLDGEHVRGEAAVRELQHLAAGLGS